MLCSDHWRFPPLVLRLLCLQPYGINQRAGVCSVCQHLAWSPFHAIKEWQSGCRQTRIFDKISGTSLNVSTSLVTVLLPLGRSSSRLWMDNIISMFCLVAWNGIVAVNYAYCFPIQRQEIRLAPLDSLRCSRAPSSTEANTFWTHSPWNL